MAGLIQRAAKSSFGIVGEAAKSVAGTAAMRVAKGGPLLNPALNMQIKTAAQMTQYKQNPLYNLPLKPIYTYPTYANTPTLYGTKKTVGGPLAGDKRKTTRNRKNRKHTRKSKK